MDHGIPWRDYHPHTVHPRTHDAEASSLFRACKRRAIKGTASAGGCGEGVLLNRWCGSRKRKRCCGEEICGLSRGQKRLA
eukprot:scaffold140756_cov295-Phaeocystis_antarctica.AAC.1